MPSAGQMRERVRFEPPLLLPPDNLGVKRKGFDTSDAAAIVCAAQFIMRPGSEAVIEARLQGQQPVDAIVRFNSRTSTITPAWRMTDTRTGTVYDITASADMDRKRQWWTVSCVSGRPE